MRFISVVGRGGPGRILSTTSAFCNRKHTERSTKRGVSGESEVRRIPRILRNEAWHVLFDLGLRFSKSSALVLLATLCSRSLVTDISLVVGYTSFVREYQTI